MIVRCKRIAPLNKAPLNKRAIIFKFIEGFCANLRICLRQNLRVCRSEACESVRGDG